MALRLSTSAYTLGYLGGSQTIDRLIEALHDSEANVRYTVIEALGKLNGIQALPQIKMIAESDDSVSRDGSIREIANEVIEMLESLN